MPHGAVNFIKYIYVTERTHFVKDRRMDEQANRNMMETSVNVLNMLGFNTIVWRLFYNVCSQSFSRNTSVGGFLSGKLPFPIAYICSVP